VKILEGEFTGGDTVQVDVTEDDEVTFALKERKGKKEKAKKKEEVESEVE
jgi:hypothetical protein